MTLHAAGFTPGRFTAGALIVMAFFRRHDAHICLRQGGKMFVAITLAKAFFGQLTTVYAMNGAGKFQTNGLADARVQIEPLIAERQLILHRAAGDPVGRHLSQVASDARR